MSPRWSSSKEATCGGASGGGGGDGGGNGGDGDGGGSGSGGGGGDGAEGVDWPSLAMHVGQMPSARSASDCGRLLRLEQ